MSFLRPSLCLVALAACGGDDVFISDAPDSGNTADGPTSGTDGSNPGVDGNVPESSVGNDASLFDPTSISGLVLWLEGSKGVTLNGSTVSAWADQTSFKNDGAQSTALQQPTFMASSINGQPALHFNKDHGGTSVGGDEIVIKDSVSLQWGRGDFYVVVVARFDNDVTKDGPERGEGLFYSKPAVGSSNFAAPTLIGGIVGSIPGGPANGMAFMTSTTAGDYVKTATLYNNGTPHALAMQRVGLQVDLRIDAVSIGTSTSAGIDVSNVGANVTIGSDFNAQALRLDGDIAEILAIKGVLAAADRTSLEGYVKSKYGL